MVTPRSNTQTDRKPANIKPLHQHERAYCTEIVKGLCRGTDLVAESEQPHLLELEFEQVAVEGLQQELRRPFEDGAADLVGIGLFGIDQHDRLAAIGGTAHAPDEFAS